MLYPGYRFTLYFYQFHFDVTFSLLNAVENVVNIKSLQLLKLSHLLHSKSYQGREFNMYVVYKNWHPCLLRVLFVIHKQNVDVIEQMKYLAVSRRMCEVTFFRTDFFHLQNKNIAASHKAYDLHPRSSVRRFVCRGSS